MLEPADFDRLLAWLDPDPDRAGQLYESIRWRLIAILASRGCHIPEELADDIIDRVARRVKDIEATYAGDKAIYFLGVMNNVHHEYLRRPPVPRLVAAGNDQVEVKEQTHVCLDRCLEKLSPHAREIIGQYYAADKSAKISLRKRSRGEIWRERQQSPSAGVAHPGKAADVYRTMHGSYGAVTRPRGPQAGSPLGVGR